MPTISTPSKIAATQAQGAQVHFSGSTAPEREAMLKDVQVETGAIFVPPYGKLNFKLCNSHSAYDINHSRPFQTTPTSSSAKAPSPSNSSNKSKTSAPPSTPTTPPTPATAGASAPPATSSAQNLRPPPTAPTASTAPSPTAIPNPAKVSTA